MHSVSHRWVVVAAALWLISMSAASAGASDVSEALRSLDRSSGGGVLSVVSPETGAVTFLRSTGAGIPLTSSADATASERARAFLRSQGRALHLPDADETLTTETAGPDEAGFERV